MITGFNTDIDHQDRVFHVQTEDKGRDNPTVETLVYTGGEIIESRKSSYEDLASSEAYNEDDVLVRMETQHQATIRDILNGKFDTEGPKPLGHNIVTNRSLDEVVLDFLGEHGFEGDIVLELIDELVLLEGTRPTLRMKVIEGESGRPVENAQVAVKLCSTLVHDLELFSAPTDEEGFVEAFFEIPVTTPEDAAILCQVDAGGRTAEIRQIIERMPAASPGPA